MNSLIVDVYELVENVRVADKWLVVIEDPSDARAYHMSDDAHKPNGVCMSEENATECLNNLQYVQVKFADAPDGVRRQTGRLLSGWGQS